MSTSHDLLAELEHHRAAQERVEIVNAIPALPSLRAARRMATLAGRERVEALPSMWGIMATERTILCHLVRDAIEVPNEPGRYLVILKMNKVATALKISDNTVRRNVRTMEQRGFLKLDQPSVSNQIPARYVIDLRNPHDADPS